ncbi:patatin-like phospholipase family protein [Candidatus Microgenomates bacterium]|nr:patatin-like phospholipase family protein [Candidatus Microgenomates bacterium]
MSQQQKFALSLSGGGLSAIAYTGFVDVLKDHHLKPACYAGLSGGAVLSVLLASEVPTSEIVKFVNKLKTFNILNTHWHHFEVIDHLKLTELIRGLLPYKTFEQLPTPVVIFTSDLTKKETVLLQTGDIASALVAACSMFPMLQPVKRRGLVLSDGGFTVYYGAKHLHDLGYKKVIGVDVTGLTEGTFKGILSALFKQINSSVSSNARYELSEWPVDLDIQIRYPSPTILNFNRKANYLISLGRKSAEKYLHSIKKIISQP